MSCSIFALLGALFVAGCAQSLPPEPHWPPPPDPIVVVDEEAPRGDDGLAERPRSDEATRQGALHVIAREQRALLGTLEDQTRFLRAASTSSRSRLRSVLSESDRELSSIEREIARLDDDDALPSGERGARQNEVKDQLRRLATRLSLVENVLRER